MTNQSQTVGKIEISIDKDLSQEILSKIHDAVSYLQRNNIRIISQESSFKDEFKVIIKILDIGDILNEQMKEALKIMFAGVKGKRNFAKLIDRDKEFRLPDDIEECLDWFIIEK